MTISIDNIISGLEKKVPQLLAGQLHTMMMEHPNWVRLFITHMAKQAKVLYINEPGMPDDQRLQLTEPVAAIQMAEWVLRRRYSMPSVLAALDELSKHTDVVILHISNAESDWVNFLFQSQQLMALEHWTKANKKVVYIFISGDTDESHVHHLLAKSANFFQSLSSLKFGQPNWEWHIDFWFWEGSILSHHFQISEAENGVLTLDIPDKGDSDRRALRYENAPIYYLNGCLDGADIAPIDWLMIDPKINWMSVLQHDSDDVIILPYFRGQPIRELLETVYNLRRNYGGHLRIFIRERDKAIRYADEKLFYQAGVTLVLPFDLGFGQAISLVENSAGWRCVKALPKSFELFMAKTVPQGLEGYCTIDEFAAQSCDLAALAEQQGLEFSLVYANASPGFNCIDLLKLYTHRREGDLITSDGEFIYFFLYGCRPQDVTQTLDYLFGIAINTLLQNEKRIHSVYLVEEFAKKMRNFAVKPDYSAELQLLEPISKERKNEAYSRSLPTSAKPVRNIEI
jgi:cellulose biosynthesis protein BcsE